MSFKQERAGKSFVLIFGWSIEKLKLVVGVELAELENRIFERLRGQIWQNLMHWLE